MSSGPTKPVLTLAAAQQVLDAAEAEARARSRAFSLVVLDDGGILLAFRRMDGIHIGTVDVAIAKARAAVSFRRPTSQFGEGIAAGQLALLSLPGLVALGGGVPIRLGGVVVGAIGVSGSSPEEDETVAGVGAAAVDGRNG